MNKSIYSTQNNHTLDTDSIQENRILVHLYSQLSNYSVSHQNQWISKLSHQGQNELFKKAYSYKKTCQKNNIPLDYHRKQFIQYAIALSKCDQNNYKGDENIRKNKPEDAAISAKELLGKKGINLYKRALKEEIYNERYLAALFNKATKFIAGSKWHNVPFIIIGGPSGCGKSFATKTYY